MRKKILFGLSALAIAAILTTKVSLVKTDQGTEISLGVMVTAAQAQTEGGGGGGVVVCDCSYIWGAGCRADNYGPHCAPQGVSQCWLYNRNCSK